jgi:hypothetical protein
MVGPIQLLASITGVVNSFYNLSNSGYEFYLKGEHPTFYLSFVTLCFCLLNQQLNKIPNIKRKLKISALPGSGNDPGKNDPGEGDNPLLNNDNVVKGIKKPFDELTTQQILNTPGVYCIHNTVTHMQYVGETVNLKARIAEHKESLLNKRHQNARLQKDWNKKSKFELIIHKQGIDCESNEVRKELERKIQKLLCLADKNLLYNSGTSETRKPRAQGQYTNQPRVFYIYSKTKDKHWVGETGQRDGIGGRVRSLIARLKTGDANSEELQKDWSKYGQEDFIIAVICYGAEFAESKTRKAKKEEIIQEILDQNLQVYGYATPANYPSSGKGPFSVPGLKAISTQLVIEPPGNSPPDWKPINLADRKPVVAEKNVYFSETETAKCLGVDANTIRGKISNGTYRLPTKEEIQGELVRRNWSIDSNLAITVPRTTPKQSPGKAVPIVVNDVVYESAAEAARQLGKSASLISKQVRKKAPGYRLLNEE